MRNPRAFDVRDMLKSTSCAADTANNAHKVSKRRIRENTNTVNILTGRFRVRGEGGDVGQEGETSDSRKYLIFAFKIPRRAAAFSNTKY